MRLRDKVLHYDIRRKKKFAKHTLFGVSAENVCIFKPPRFDFLQYQHDISIFLDKI